MVGPERKHLLADAQVSMGHTILLTIPDYLIGNLADALISDFAMFSLKRPMTLRQTNAGFGRYRLRRF